MFSRALLPRVPRILAAAALAATSAPWAAAARADTADWLNLGPWQLLVQDGDRLVRTLCDATTTIHDRGTCTQDHRTVSAAAFYDAVSTPRQKTVDDDARLVRETQINIGRIDDKLEEMLATRPVAQPSLRDDIAAANAALAKRESDAATLGDQLARLRDAIAQHDDADLRGQLAADEQQLAKTRTDIETQHTHLVDLHERFIGANAALLDPQTYQDLWARRASFTKHLQDQQRAYLRALDVVAACFRVFKQLADQTYVWEYDNDSPSSLDTDVVRTFQSTFETLNLASRTFKATVLSGYALEMTVTRSAPLETWSCVMSRNTGSCEGLRVTAPAGQTFDGSWFTFDLRNTDGYCYPNELCPIKALPSMEGHWTIDPVCTPVGSTPPPLVDFDCTMVLQEPR